MLIETSSAFFFATRIARERDKLIECLNSAITNVLMYWSYNRRKCHVSQTDLYQIPANHPYLDTESWQQIYKEWFIVRVQKRSTRFSYRTEKRSLAEHLIGHHWNGSNDTLDRWAINETRLMILFICPRIYCQKEMSLSGLYDFTSWLLMFFYSRQSFLVSLFCRMTTTPLSTATATLCAECKFLIIPCIVSWTNKKIK